MSSFQEDEPKRHCAPFVTASGTRTRTGQRGSTFTLRTSRGGATSTGFVLTGFENLARNAKQDGKDKSSSSLPFDSVKEVGGTTVDGSSVTIREQCSTVASASARFPAVEPLERPTLQ